MPILSELSEEFNLKTCHSMSLKTDIIFVKALESNTDLMASLPAKDVYNTSIAVPDYDLDNAPIPYIVVSFDGMQNEDATKDGSYEGETDRVQISVEVVAKTRPQLCDLATAVRETIKEFFEDAQPTDDDYELVPLDYTLTAQAVNYDSDNPCYWQILSYNCDTNV